MAGALGIVFGLCVLSFTLGAALMYCVVRRQEDAVAVTEPAVEEASSSWVAPEAVEPVASDYDSRPIYRNPVVGLPQLEPALASFAEPVVEPELQTETETEAEPEPVAEVEPVVEPEPEPVVEVGLEVAPVVEVEEPVSPPEPEPVSVVEPEPELESEVDVVAEVAPVAVVEPEVVETAAPVVAPTVDGRLPGPAAPQAVEHTTSAEREQFRRRYLQSFEEVRRKASRN